MLIKEAESTTKSQDGREEYRFSLRGFFIDMFEFKFHDVNHEFNLLIYTTIRHRVECRQHATVLPKEETPSWVATLHTLGRVKEYLYGKREID